jgi:hypothetical protein
MVFLKAPKDRELIPGAIVTAHITESTEYDLWGKIRS